MANRSATSRGFTLLELLVVIAIIALLIGILLPTLGVARKNAQATKSLANLRSHGQGLALYTGDHGVFVPFKMEGTHHTGRVNARYHWIIGDLLGWPPYLPQNAEEQFQFENNNDFDRLDHPVFLDPVHSVEDMRSEQSGEIQVLRCGSYGYNFRYLGNTRGGLDGRPDANHPVPESRVLNPSRTVSFGTSGGGIGLRPQGFREHAYTLDAPRLAPGETNTDRWGHDTASYLEARHLGRAQAVWLDGHVASKRLEDFGHVVGSDSLPIQDEGSNALWNGRGFDRDATTPTP
ncbi:MAG: prepilin-type N-terminal cleavage/methylation domain-containing protein [Planctomycetota bacterium]